MSDVLLWIADLLISLVNEAFFKAVIVYVFVLAVIVFAVRELTGRWLTVYFRAPRWRNSCIAMAAGHVLLLWAWWGGHVKIALWPSLFVILLVNIALDFRLLWYLFKEKSAVRKKMEQISDDLSDLLKSHRQWLEIDRKRLEPKDAKYWNQGYYHILYHMGNIEKSAQIARKTEKEGTAKYLEWQALYEEARGNIEKAIELTRQALAATEEKEWRLKAELLNNWGRCNRICGNNKEALKYFNRAADMLPVDEKGELVCAVYSNLIFTSCLEYGDTDMDQTDRLICELENHLNLTDPKEALEVENIKLEVARQRKEQAQIEELIDKGHDRILSLFDKESDGMQMRLIYEASSLHVAHTAELALGKYMDSLKADFEEIFRLRMPEKYYILKEIFVLLLEPPIINQRFYQQYQEIFERTTKYIVEEAREELKEYLDDLHEDAIYAYGNTLIEMAWIEKYTGNYDYTRVYNNIQSVCDTYEKQGLLVEAMTRRLILVQETVSPMNIDENFDLRWKTLFRENLDKAAKIAETLKLHPGHAGNFFNLAYGYMRIHAYEKGRHFYRKFLDCHLSPEHYTPWTRQNIAFVKILSEVLSYDETLRKLRDHPAMIQSLSQKAREWVRSYPDNTSEDITLLFGGLLKEEPVTGKMMLWNERSKTGIWIRKKHFWLSYSPVPGAAGPEHAVLELDLKYNEVSGEEERIAEKGAAFDGMRILYFPERHPLQTGASIWAKEHVKRDPEDPAELHFMKIKFPIWGEKGEMTYLEEIRRCVWDESSL